MWSEEINKKVLEGEDRNHPKYPDKAWDDMEALLDKHLPLKKKRRRFILFLFPALLGLGLATFYFLQKPNKPEPVTAQKNIPGQPSTSLPARPGEKNTNQATPPGITAPAETIAPAGKGGIQKEPGKKSEEELNIIDNQEPGTKIPDPVIAKQANRTTKRAANKPVRQLKDARDPDQPDLITSKPVKNSNTKVEPAVKNPVEAGLPVIKGDQPITDAPAIKPAIADSNSNPVTAAADEKKPADSIQNDLAKTTKPAQKTKRSFGDKFSLNFSFGPDISAVGIDNPGRVQFQYGIGAAYAITKNLSVRTGFYAGDKKYTADSSDYHNPYPINKLEKVEADCFVYEIPLTFVYNFDPVRKHNWFVAGGVSSYFMKKETYGYYYKNTWGQQQYYSRSYKNENKHLFSVIGLSGGYQYHFSDRISFLAEPYVKFPVSGIGVGKVKLNNTGILFTIGYKPFSKK